MKALQHQDAGTASSLVTSQIRTWHRINECFIYLLERWARASKDLRLESFDIIEQEDTQAKGKAFGKNYKVLLSSTLRNAKLLGRVSVLLTNPRVGDPTIVCEFLIGSRGEYLTTDGDVLVEDPDTAQEYQLIVEAILQVIQV